MQADPRSRTLNLRAGDVVQVRTIEEILATLDERGRFEALPFMPEMLHYCGRRMRVVSRADKTCDTIGYAGLSRMADAVHLEGIRCDGGHHGACEAKCLIYWKEAWLTRVSEDAPADPMPALDPTTHPGVERIMRAARADGNGDAAGIIYSCQATEARHFTTPLCRHGEKAASWDDARCGNVSWLAALRAMAVERFNEFQQRRGGTTYPPIVGRAVGRPPERPSLNLQPGELVRVRTRDEICQTLPVGSTKNKGLSFDREMMQFCGSTYRVDRRINKIVDESTGRMITMKRDCIVLEGVGCEGRYHGLCQRAVHAYWRESWLERADGAPPMRGPKGEGSFVAFVVVSAIGMVMRRLLRRRPVPAGQVSGA